MCDKPSVTLFAFSTVGGSTRQHRRFPSELGGVISLSGVCDLVLAYKNEPLPLDVHHELLGLLNNLHMGLKAELTIDPSYVIGARCLDTLIQDRRAAVEVARSLSNQGSV